MAVKSKLDVNQRMEAVLSLIRREEPAKVIARRYQVSENTLYQWRERFLENGKAGLTNNYKRDNHNNGEIKQLKKEIAERDRVIGELTIANRILKKTSDNLS